MTVQLNYTECEDTSRDGTFRLRFLTQTLPKNTPPKASPTMPHSEVLALPGSSTLSGSLQLLLESSCLQVGGMLVEGLASAPLGEGALCLSFCCCVQEATCASEMRCCSPLV